MINSRESPSRCCDSSNRMLENMLLFLILAGLFRGHQASPSFSKVYHYVDQKLSWANAQQYCREHYEDLATIDNVAELQQLQESRTGFDYDTDSMWIGLYEDPTSWNWSLNMMHPGGVTV